MLNSTHLRRSLLILAGWLAGGSAAEPRFDVASLKAVPAAPGNYHDDLGTANHGEVTLTNVTLSPCLHFAFGVNNDDLIAGPAWMKSRDFRFTIVAKAPPETPLPELRLMLQALLEERFRMAVHHEAREQKYLALLVGKKGLKITETADEADARGGRQIMGKIISNRMQMEQLALLLSRFLHQPVLDRTGSTGRFGVQLEWAPEGSQATDSDTGALPSIFVAVQQQLGLTLEARQGPLDTIVVDRADKTPIEN